MFCKLWAHSRQQGREVQGRATVGDIQSRSGDGVEDCLALVVLSWMLYERLLITLLMYLFLKIFYFWSFI